MGAVVCDPGGLETAVHVLREPCLLRDAVLTHAQEPIVQYELEPVRVVVCREHSQLQELAGSREVLHVPCQQEPHVVVGVTLPHALADGLQCCTRSSRHALQHGLRKPLHGSGISKASKGCGAAAYKAVVCSAVRGSCRSLPLSLSPRSGGLLCRGGCFCLLFWTCSEATQSFHRFV